jgi:hypothetical protein
MESNIMKPRITFALTVLCALLAASPSTLGAVSAEEAAKLKTVLTPFGAERAGNKDGTIPAWDGGYTKVPAGYQSGKALADPFASEKPLYSISASNMAQHADKLSEGVKALLTKYPSSFRLDVYPTHRTAAAPQWIYDNTFKNATRAKTTSNGVWIEGAYGGIPFPIPKDGFEAMWNHKLAWVGGTTITYYQNFLGLPDGKRVLAAQGVNRVQFPYYDQNAQADSFQGVYKQLRVVQTDPPFKSGESFLLLDAVDRPRQAWQYLVGQRRVRKAPTIGYDTPDDITSGAQNYDQAFVFLGDLDRYDWKLVGKKEMLIPYNNQKLYATPTDKQFAPHHLNPDVVRWELHRVWVVEASLVPGKRHTMPKRRFYLDEDTWAAILADHWDAHGALWHASVSMPLIVPEGPFVAPYFFWTTFNLLTGGWVTGSGPNYENGPFMKVIERLPMSFFTPEALAGEGVR